MAGKRSFWLGVIIGFIVMVLLGSLPVLGPIIGGFIAGLISRGGPWGGATAGFVAGLFGAIVISVIPTFFIESITYSIIALSPTISNSFGIARVIGSNLVPRPAAGIIPFIFYQHTPSYIIAFCDSISLLPSITILSL